MSSVRPCQGSSGGVQDTTDHENPWLLKLEASMSLYRQLLAASAGKGIIYNENGDHCGTVVLPHAFLGENPEASYDRPEGFVLISRNFPCLSEKRDDIVATCTSELTAAGIQVNPSSIQMAVDLNKEFKKTLRSKLTSKLRVVLERHIVDQEFKSEKAGSRICKEASEVYAIFRNELPTVQKLRKIFNAFIKPFEDGTEVNKAVFEVMLDCKFWYANGKEYELLNLTSKKQTPKKARVRTIAMHCVREFRHVFTERQESKHQVTLKISLEGGRGNKKRKKGVFDPSTMIGGWKGPKHLQFVRDNPQYNQDIPDLPFHSPDSTVRPVLFDLVNVNLLTLDLVLGSGSNSSVVGRFEFCPCLRWPILTNP